MVSSGLHFLSCKSGWYLWFRVQGLGSWGYIGVIWGYTGALNKGYIGIMETGNYRDDRDYTRAV